MPRYIDAEKLCDLARNHVDCAVTPNDIMRFPAADVHEVVLCKDCKYRDPEDKKCDSFVRFKNPFPTDDDDFCPYGKRKG